MNEDLCAKWLTEPKELKQEKKKNRTSSSFSSKILIRSMRMSSVKPYEWVKK